MRKLDIANYQLGRLAGVAPLLHANEEMCAMIHDPQTPAQVFRLRRQAVRHLSGEINLHLNAAFPFWSRNDFARERWVTEFSPYSELSKVPVTRFPCKSSVITVSVLSPLFLNVVGLAETHRPVASRIATAKASLMF